MDDDGYVKIVDADVARAVVLCWSDPVCDALLQLSFCAWRNFHLYGREKYCICAVAPD